MTIVKVWLLTLCIFAIPSMMVGEPGSDVRPYGIEDRVPALLFDSIQEIYSPSDKGIQGFGFGPLVATLFSKDISQIFFPGFSIFSSRANEEVLFDFRGRFFFGELDGYHLELAGYRFISQSNPRFFMGGGIGYGGMNLKENLVFDINGVPVAGVFYQNGNGLHAFLGIGTWVKQTGLYHFRADLDYYLSLYNVGSIQSPTGFRFTCSMFLHSPWN